MRTNNKNILVMAGILVLGILLGWIFFGNDAAENEHNHAENEEKGQVWTCSMHPQIRQSEPGQCPICGMDLIPASSGGDELDASVYQMSENAMKLANITTMEVGNGEVSKNIRLNGKIEVNEKNSYTQSTHIPGRIEQMRVNFTGEKVNRGQTLAIVYSPAIVTAQEELLQAARIRESQPELFEAAKRKLRNWKISEAQINNMLNRNEPIDRFPISADVSGVVTKLMAEQGDYLERGMPIYQIANLDKVWVLFDLYESDLNWVKEGSKVEYTVQSIPGETFEGTISFIDPILNDNTRVATARIEVDNSNGQFKPGMFVSAQIETDMSQNGQQQMVIPRSAVLWTGERSVVYVKKSLESGVGFELREVNLGTATGDSYVVKSGLQPGEEIVVNGTFTVDSAVQLAGKPSMMNPDMNMQAGKEIAEKDKKVLMPLFMNYLQLKDQLVADDFDSAKNTISKIQQNSEAISEEGLTEETAENWGNFKPGLQNSVQKMKEAKDISALRENFDELSSVMIGIAKIANPMPGMYVLRCPMANSNRGADWLSMNSEIKNPYYGQSMLTCGEIKAEIK
ncbi:MAG: efflux RND transporter periplasmic adaptor subunit [Christiangramia sp.]|nr:efflux transporter periplasmic adaptor subunit [Christiangramia sp.]